MATNLVAATSPPDIVSTTNPLATTNPVQQNPRTQRDIHVFKTLVGQTWNHSTGTVNITPPNANVRVCQIQFQTAKMDEIESNSVVEVSLRQYYTPGTQAPTFSGPLDPRLGTSSKDGKCYTCAKPLIECVGHFGHLQLELPVFHIGFIRDIGRILQAICKRCSRVLLPSESHYEYYLNLAKNAVSDRRKSIRINDDVLDLAKRVKICPHCEARQGQVKKITGLLKFVHDLRVKETKKDRERKMEEETLRKRQVRERLLQQQQEREAMAAAQALGGITSVVNGSFESFNNSNSSTSSSTFLNTASSSWTEELKKSVASAERYNPEIAQHLDKVLIEISPLQCLRLFQNVTNDDCFLLNLDPSMNRPENLIMTRLAVPPVCIRPSVSMGASGTNEDDLTIKIGEIVQTNALIRSGFSKGLPTANIVQHWDFLQQLVSQYINSDLPGVSKSLQPTKPIRALVQRLKGKQGRFRGNLSGKRVDFSGRTVISPDPNLAIDQVGVPTRVAKVLTFPEKVTRFNIQRLRTCVLNGPDTHPGANTVEWAISGRKVNLRFAKRSQCAGQLAIGDIVERHLDDNDVVLFNRQPSLHRMSIMAHRVKVHEWRTLRFNECCCTPYNADFDGDEMNIHLPQTYEAKAEASELMSVLQNLVTPRHGEPLVCATQDFITGSFLITSKNRFLTRAQFLQYTTYMDDGGDMSNERLVLPPPAVLKPMQMWTGKQLFSFVLSPKHAQSGLNYVPYSPSGIKAHQRPVGIVNVSGFGAPNNNNTNNDKKKYGDKDETNNGLQLGDKFYCPKLSYTPNYTVYRDLAFPSITIEVRASNCKKAHCMDPNDGFITIRNSELMSGNITKDALGGSKGGMYYQIIRAGTDGVLSAARFLSRVAKFTSRFVQSQGFSIGIDDVTPSKQLTLSKQRLIDNGYAKSQDYINQYKQGKLQLRPGCNELETLEASLLMELSAIRSDAGQQCFDQLNILYNTPLIMAVSGSKGSKINISQMTACVGQQAISGSRIPEGFHLRTLPHFPKHSRDPNAKGFVQNSFFTGLTAPEFFMHTMGGREGLVDTAVKTAETGYMQRRLLKALEDLCVHYDRSVRTSEGNIIQFVYGDDGLDPLFMADAPLPVNFNLFWGQISAIVQAWAKPYQYKNYRTVPSPATTTTTTAATSTTGRGKNAVKAAAAATTTTIINPLDAPPTNIIDCFSTAPISLASVIPKAALSQFTSMHLNRTDDTRNFVDWVSIVLNNPYKFSIPSSLLAQDPSFIEIQNIINKYIPPRNNAKVSTMEDNDDTRSLADIITPHRLEQLLHPHTYMLPIEMMIVVCGFVLHPQTISLCSTRFIKSMLLFAEKEYETMEEILKFDQQKHNPESTQVTSNLHLLLQTKPISSIHVNLWLNGSKSKYLSSVIEPGTAVGAIAGQSIGEPGTQMTLKTFHFAGVASMSITQGVPRIKEIINASKKIATPIITVPLEITDDPRVARVVKGRIETTTLGHIAKRIEAYFTSSSCGIDIELDFDVIEALQLSIDYDSVMTALRTARKLKFKDNCRIRTNVDGNQVITISGLTIDSTARSNNSYACAASMLQLLHGLKHEVAKVIVRGIHTVSRAVINDEGDRQYSLIVEGYDMLSVMGTPGIRGTQVKSNHVIEIAHTLGIEAARQTIITEIKSSMDNYGLTIDMRHMSLLADIMTYRGEVLGITRFGIAKMKESTLMLASFEKTSDHLFEAALRGVGDDVKGVSESIILGKTIPVGTGILNILQQSHPTAVPTTLSYDKQLAKLNQLPKIDANLKPSATQQTQNKVRHLNATATSTGTIPPSDVYQTMGILPKMNNLLQAHQNTCIKNIQAKENLEKIKVERKELGIHELSNAKSAGARSRLKHQQECQSEWGLTQSALNDQDLTFTERQLSPEELAAVRHIEEGREPHHLQGRSTFTQADPFSTKIPLVAQFNARKAS